MSKILRFLKRFLRHRYVVWRSDNGLDWIPIRRFHRESPALSWAACFAAHLRWYHVEVTDGWADGKMIWHISANCQQLAIYHRVKAMTRAAML